MKVKPYAFFRYIDGETQVRYPVEYLQHLAPRLDRVTDFIVGQPQILTIDNLDTKYLVRGMAFYHDDNNAVYTWRQVIDAEQNIFVHIFGLGATFYFKDVESAYSFVSNHFQLPVITSGSAYVPQTIPSSWYEEPGQPTDADAGASGDFGAYEDVGRKRADDHERLGTDTIDPSVSGN